MSDDTIRDGFFEECTDLLADLADGLDAMAAGGTDGETVNAIFRAVHSIKGGAGAFGLEALVGFSHGFENALDLLRQGRIDPSADLIALFHRATDQLADLVAATRSGAPVPPGFDAVLRDLEDLVRTGSGTGDPGGLDFEPVAIDWNEAEAGQELTQSAHDVAASDCVRDFLIRFSPFAALYDAGHEPLHLFAELDGLGDLTLSADLSGCPDFPGAAGWITWEGRLKTGCEPAAIFEIFEFVEGLVVLWDYKCPIAIGMDKVAIGKNQIEDHYRRADLADLNKGVTEAG